MADVQQPALTLTLGQKLFLVLGVPLIFLVGVEIACSVFDLPSKISGDPKDSLVLDMPVWMQLEDNTRARMSADFAPARAADWLDIFETGPGFRVRLVPNIAREVTNTFSLIRAEADQRYSIHANSLGFRGKEISPSKAPGVFRILVFGDSSSFGWGVNQDETFSALLPSLLAGSAGGKTIEVANFAIPGDSSEYGRLIFDTYAAKYDGDLVILGFGANDAKKVLYPHDTQVKKFTEQRSLQHLKFYLAKSSLFRTLEALFKKNGAAEVPPPSNGRTVSAVSKRRYVDNLDYMAAQSAVSGARQTIFLALCTPGNYAKRAAGLAARSSRLFFNGQSHLLEMLPRIIEGAVHPEIVADMRAAYGAELNRDKLFYVSSDGCHPNKLGQRIVAERLAAIITESGVLTQGRPEA